MPLVTYSKVLFSASIVGIISAISFWYYKYYRHTLIPTKWRRIGSLAKFYFFPIKSCGAIEIPPDTEIYCDFLGLRYDDLLDRALIVLDLNNEMKTARTYNKMYQIKSKKIDRSKLRLTAPGMSEIVLDFDMLLKGTTETEAETVIWGSNVFVKFCGEKYDRWFSEFLLGSKNGMRLAYYPHLKPTRPVAPKWNEPYLTSNDTGTFGDFTSYMLMNLHSVEDLNSRLEEPVDSLQFRGNFYIKMDKPEPYAEDNWDFIKIGEEAVFRNVLPCTRCIIPNIHVDGEIDPQGNPLKTLKSYRKWEKYASPVFGIHMGLRRQGSIKLNDAVYVEDNEK